MLKVRGVVEAIGDGVDGFSVGDRVARMGAIGAGGYGSHSLIGAPYVTHIADKVDFNTAASVPRKRDDGLSYAGERRRANRFWYTPLLEVSEQ